MTFAKKPDQTYIFPNIPSSDALHKPFSWLVEALQHDPAAQLSSVMKNFGFGIKTCLELIHATDLASGEYADPASPPVLSVTARERLLLFALDAAGELAEKADRDIEHRNDKHLRERR